MNKENLNKNVKPTLVVLAAGMGSRYGGLKQIDPVGPAGETILDYSIFDAVRAGFGKVVFVIRRDIENLFKEKVGSKFKSVISVEYAYQQIDALVPECFIIPKERTKPWGTAHAILVAKDMVNEPFAVINADDFYGSESYKLMYDYLIKAKDVDFADYSMVGFVLRNTLSDFGSVSRGVCKITNDFLIDVTERTSIERKNNDASFINENNQKTDIKGDEIVSMNMFGFTPSIFKYLENLFKTFLDEEGIVEKSEFFIPSVVAELINANIAKMKVLKTPNTWFGVTYKEDKPFVIAKVAELIKQNKYPNNLWNT